MTGDARELPPAVRPRMVNLSLAGALVLLAAWVLLAFVFPVGAGWPHLLMAGGVILLIRRVVAGPRTW